MLLHFENLSLPSLLYQVRWALVIAEVVGGEEAAALVGGEAAIGGRDEAAVNVE